MPRVKVNGVSLYYELHGTGEPIAMIAGYGASSESWCALPAGICDLTCTNTVLLFDNRGTGRSDHPDTAYTIRTMADDLVGILDTLTIDATHVLGISMGGMIAQELALTYPEKVKTLILRSTLCSWPSLVTEVPDFLERCVAADLTVMSAAEARAFQEWVWSVIYTPEQIDANRAQLHNVVTVQYPTPRHTFRRHADAIMSHDVYDRLPQIQASTLVIHGARDRLVSPENARVLAERIPNAQLLIYPHDGHSFSPATWNEMAVAIQTFIA
jgi:pimeloyl-ACP methyl ester carboxylesterase